MSTYIFNIGISIYFISLPAPTCSSILKLSYHGHWSFHNITIVRPLQLCFCLPVNRTSYMNFHRQIKLVWSIKTISLFIFFFFFLLQNSEPWAYIVYKNCAEIWTSFTEPHSFSQSFTFELMTNTWQYIHAI